jgi:putative ABC transport system permease protein
MPLLGNLTGGLRSLFRKESVERELDEELRAYLEMATNEKIKNGMSPEEARRAVRHEVGSLDAAKEAVRTAGWEFVVETWWQDIRYGLRRIMKQPAFTAAAVLTLALGVGATTTIFSVIYGVLLDPFPYVNSDRVAVVQIQDTAIARPVGRTAFPLPEFLDYQAQNHVFDEVIGGGHEDVLITTGEGPEQYDGAYVTPNTFRFLGVPALLGRGLEPADGVPGAPPVFVMSYKMWLGRYNLDRAILGRSFILNNVPTTLVGIMPPRFTKFAADLWRAVPLDGSNPEINRRSFRLQARLKPGVTFKQAEADIDAIAHRLAAIYPKNYPTKFTVRVVSWVDSLIVQFRTTLYTLAAAVGLLLLIACSNVANMLLAKASAREKEIAIRAAIGASRGRVVRQMLIESGLLALCGAAVGWLMAYVGVKTLVPLMPVTLLPSEVVIGLNMSVLVASLIVTVATALLFGLLPAIKVVRHNVVESLKDSSKGTSGGAGGGQLRNALVVVEVALSLVLLVGAGLLMGTVVALQRVDLGLNPDRIFVARVPLPRGQYGTAAAKQRFFQTLLPRLQALPGVVAAAESTGLPIYGFPINARIAGEIDVPGQTHTERWDAAYQLCSEGYFPALSLRLVRGRTLSNFDVNDARKVAVVNETLANHYFGALDPIGRQLKLSMLESLPNGAIENPRFEVVGVIADVKNRGIQEAPMPEVLIPYTVTGAFDRGIIVKTAGDPRTLLNVVRREIWAVDGNVALTFATTLTEYLRQFSYAEPRFSMTILAVFAGIGLVLALIGVYSLIAYVVSQRTQEIGIRMALGASGSDVLWLVLRMGFRLIGTGLAVGILASFAVTRMIAAQLWGVSPHDPATLIEVIVFLVIAGLAACYLPARKATTVDPIVALKIE